MVIGDDAVYGILADPCNCQNYYQCEYNTTLEVFIAYERACNPCELWDQEVLTCVFNPDAVWVPECNPSTQTMGMKQLALLRKVKTYSGIDIIIFILNFVLDYFEIFFIFHVVYIWQVVPCYLRRPNFATIHRVFQLIAHWEKLRATHTRSCWATKPWIVHPEPFSTSLCAHVCITVCALFVQAMQITYELF